MCLYLHSEGFKFWFEIEFEFKFKLKPKFEFEFGGLPRGGAKPMKRERGNRNREVGATCGFGDHVD